MLEVKKDYVSCVICKYFAPEELKLARHYARIIGGIVTDCRTGKVILDYEK